MNKDVAHNLEKLMQRYLVTESRVLAVRSSPVPTTRAATRAEARVVDAIGTLQEGRKAPSKALVRLAYVRALRDVNPDARMNEEQEREARNLWDRLDVSLGRVEWLTLVNFRSHLRKLCVINAVIDRSESVNFVDTIRQSDRAYPLQLRARVSVLEALEIAAAAGALAGTASGNYDGEQL